MAFPSVEANDRSRARLRSLTAQLSDDDLALSTPYGWTVAALLAHLAWWDQRVLVLLRRWKEKGVDESPVDSQAVNEALRPLGHAIEPRRAMALCLASAKAVDAELETLTPDLVERIEAGATQFRFNRALHRNDHLHDIEGLLPSRVDSGGA